MARLMAVILIAAGLAACAREDEAAAPPAEALPVGEVAAADELGPFASDVTDIAFWTHPALPFQGLVLVAAADGVTALNIEDGEPIARIDAANAESVEVVYSGSGALAHGIAIVSSSGKLSFHEISNETRAFVPLAAKDVPSSVGAFCAGPDRDGALRLFALAGRAVAAYAIAIKDGAVEMTSGATAEAPAEIDSCVVDPVDGTVFLAGADGGIYRAPAGGKIDSEPFAMSAATAAKAIGVALNGLIEGGPTELCCGQIAVLDGADASVRFYDRDDGNALGSVRLASSFDVEGVAVATAMGVGFGNFGGVYRDGVLALATDGAAPHVRLAPLNGVLHSLSATIGETADPRALSPQAPADDGLIIDVDLVKE